MLVQAKVYKRGVILWITNEESFYGLQMRSHFMDYKWGVILWITNEESFYGLQMRSHFMDYKWGVILWITNEESFYGLQMRSHFINYKWGVILWITKEESFYGLQKRSHFMDTDKFHGFDNFSTALFRHFYCKISTNVLQRADAFMPIFKEKLCEPISRSSFLDLPLALNQSRSPHNFDIKWCLPLIKDKWSCHQNCSIVAMRRF